MKYKHIIWDWNGTILDDRWLCVAVINEMLNARNMPLMDEKRYLSTFGFPIKEYYQRVGFDFLKESFEVITVEFMNLYRKRQFECHLHAGSTTVLQTIRKHGLKQSVLSAMENNLLNSMISRYGVTDFFQDLIGLDNDFAHSKIENGKRHLQQLELNADEVLFVGDTLHDFEVAQDIGTDVLLVENGHHPRERLVATGAVIVSSIQEVQDYIINSQ